MAWLRRMALAGLALLPLAAEARPRNADLDALAPVATGTVQSVQDGATLTLDDGKVLRLAGLIAPAAPLAMDKDAPWPAGDAARQALAGLALRRTVTLRAAEDKPDRHDRLVGQIVMADGTWLQRDLVRQGADRFEPTREMASLAPMLLKAEADARRHHRGLWRLPAYAVRSPDHLTARDTGGFVLVEGRVLSVAPTHEATFLDFAEDWHHGFTVRLPRAVLQRADGFDPAVLEGRRVRVRGWLAFEGRPILDLEDVTALELLPNGRKANQRP